MAAPAAPGLHRARMLAGAEDAQHGVLSTVMITLIPAAAASLVRRSVKAERARSITGRGRLQRGPRDFDTDHPLPSRALAMFLSIWALGPSRRDVHAAEQGACLGPPSRGHAPRTPAATTLRSMQRTIAPATTRRLKAPDHPYTIDAPRAAGADMQRPLAVASLEVSPTWIWMQGAIVIFVVIGMIIAITKLV